MNFFIVRGINYYWNYLFGRNCNYNYVELNYDLCFHVLKKNLYTTEMPLRGVHD